MIIPNGYIEVQSITGGGIDPVTGHANAFITHYGNKIHCQYVKTENLNGRIEGESQTMPSYTIYIEDTGVNLNSEKIRLSDKNNTIIGIFSVKSIEPLEVVNQIMLTI